LTEATHARPSRDLLPAHEERAIIARLQRGDRAAFASLYEAYADPLYRSAILPHLPDPLAAEDVLRESFRRALENIHRFTSQDRSIFFWLRRIAINLATDVFRARTRDRRLTEAVMADPQPIIPDPDAPDRGVEQEDTRREVEISLSRLNPRYAEVLRLRLIDEVPREACAARLGVSLGNLDVLLHRAVKAFREEYPP
jgi:RNA polymerase sigma factor (sigma-70 family)